MFLDEKLYQKGLEIKPDFSNDLTIIKEMIWICIENSEEILKNSNIKDSELPAIFKRINNSWNMAIKRLDKENKHFVKENGFLLYLLENSDFEALHKIIKTILK